MLFWILTGAVVLVLSVALVAALLRGRRETGPAEAFDLQIYRDQLREVVADAESGKIPADEAERLKVEISRRLLAADAKVHEARTTDTQPRLGGYVAAGVMALVLVAGGFGLYTRLGAPGYPDLPRQMRIDQAAATLNDRPSQAEVEARQPASAPVDVPEDYQQLVAQLREAVASRPDDIQGHQLLVRHEAALGNFKAAYEAQARLVELKGDTATVRDLTDLADMMVIAAGGYVSPEAQAVLQKVLARDPSNGVARFYGGLLMAQTGRPDQGFRMWDRLLRESDANDPWVAPIRAQIEDLAFRAGESNYSLPAPSGRGPTQADIDAASEMSAEDRMEMIRGMVGNLSDKLAAEGGPPEEWARLITSLGVLEETGQARAIFTEAQTVFAGNDAALAEIRQAAERAGLVEAPE